MTPLVLWLALTPDASACGGLFCDTRAPVEQTGERIIFKVDEATGEVETHVEIAYTGDAAGFAWIVPTPGLPTLELSTVDLFDALERPTRPQWLLSWRTETCVEDDVWESDVADSDVDFDTDTEAGPDTGALPGVVVVSREDVGPYDVVTLQADDASNLTTWLQREQFSIPPDFAAAVAPYVASGSSFLAFKLTNAAGVDEIRPVSISYAGDRALIPMTLTQVAAVPDTRLTVWVAGASRAVPESYLHVVVDELGVDWYRAGMNWPAQVAQAANEAGGQAFATEFAGPMPTVTLRGEFLSTASIAAATSVEDALLLAASIAAAPETVNAVARGLLLPPTLDAAALLSRPWVFSDFLATLDATPQDLADALEEEVVAPRRRARALLSGSPYLTRLLSSMSPDEMDKDPSFRFRTDMPSVDAVRRATLWVDCDREDPGIDEVWEAPRRLQLSDGRVMPLPPGMAGGTWSDLTSSVLQRASLRVEDLSGEEIVVVQDAEDEVRDRLDELLEDVSPDAGVPSEIEAAACGGCAGAGGAPAGWLGLLALVGLRRRR